jgi:hypothetical protein
LGAWIAEVEEEVASVCSPRPVRIPTTIFTAGLEAVRTCTAIFTAGMLMLATPSAFEFFGWIVSLLTFPAVEAK